MLFRFDFSGKIGVFQVSHLCIKLYTAAVFGMSNAFESPHEIQMPVCSAEFSVGDCMVAGCFLFCNNVADAVIGDGIELGLCDLAVLELFFCVFEFLWS